MAEQLYSLKWKFQKGGEVTQSPPSRDPEFWNDYIRWASVRFSWVRFWVSEWDPSKPGHKPPE